MLYDNKQVIEAKKSFLKQFSGRIDIGVVLGSGLSDVFNDDDLIKEIEYSSVKNLKTSSVSGHKNRFLLFRIKEKTIIAMQGRVHLYEGYSAFDVCLPIALFGEMGIKNLVLTNAAGAIDPAFQVGDIMAITDHINLQGTSPLIGISDSSKFIDLTHTYDTNNLGDLQKRFHIRAGSYAGVLGPNFETPAEIRYLRTIGANAVGMSTVMEAIMANYYKMRVFGFSLITNMAAGMVENQSHSNVLQAAKGSVSKMGEIIRYITAEIID